MLESDRCCRRKPLRQTHASCLRERCSSALNPVATRLSWSPSRFWQLPRRLEEARLGEERGASGKHRETSRSRLLFAESCKAPEKMSQGSLAARPTASPPYRALLRATGTAVPARAAPTPARLDASRFPLDLSENSAAGGQGRRVPLAANLSPKAFSAGQALKQQSQSEALNSCNLS